MNLFSRVWARFNTGGLSNRETGAQQDGPTTVQTHAGITLGDDGALGISAVWACVQLITNAIASLPVEWYRKIDGGRELLDIDHPLSRLFLLRPNQFMKTRDFRKALTFQMAFWNHGGILEPRLCKDRLEQPRHTDCNHATGSSQDGAVPG